MKPGSCKTFRAVSYLLSQNECIIQASLANAPWTSSTGRGGLTYRSSSTFLPGSPSIWAQTPILPSCEWPGGSIEDLGTHDSSVASASPSGFDDPGFVTPHVHSVLAKSKKQRHQVALDLDARVFLSGQRGSHNSGDCAIRGPGLTSHHGPWPMAQSVKQSRDAGEGRLPPSTDRQTDKPCWVLQARFFLGASSVDARPVTRPKGV